MQSAVPIFLACEERATLEKWARAARTPQRLALRARIILLAADGGSNSGIARKLSVSLPTVQQWRRRFDEGRCAALKDRPRAGRQSHRIPPNAVKKVIEATLHTQPLGRTHWSSRAMSKAVGMSTSSVQRIWRAHKLQPHRSETFKLSRDPQFVEKLTDVVGLYLHPPEKSVVLSVDEKSQIQALERTRAVQPLAPGVPERRPHDYRRHGTTTLFSALNMLDGKVTGECHPRHTNGEFLQFLQRLDTEMPPELALHVIVDNYATHKHPNVQAWLAEHPRWHLHFTPTASSWVNMVERFFAGLTTHRIRRGSFRSVSELETAIAEYIAETNRRSKPLVWTASVERILGKISRYQAICESRH
jgi:transposase